MPQGPPSAPVSAAMAAVPAMPPSKSPSPSANGIGAIAEVEGFDSIYSAAQVPSSPYSAEKLLRVLDGLKAMPAPTRKAAVLAMDAADEEWSVADAVLDAQRKTKALAARIQQLSSDLQTIQTNAQAEKQKRDDFLNRAREQIMEKINDLQRQLESETATMLTEKTEIDSAVFAAEQAHQRETRRLNNEAARLGEIPHIFAIERSGAVEG